MRKPHKKTNYVADLEADGYFHIYNRTNNQEILFREEADRIFFLHKYKKYLGQFVNTFSYALMGTHFHLCVKIKSMDEIEKHIQKIHSDDRSIAQKAFLEMPSSEKTVKDILQNQFSRFFNSYSKKFNLKWNRRGNLFHRPFKRIEITSADHFSILIYYHHLNCLKHKLFYDFKNYKWSSYQALISDAPTSLDRKTVLDWFGGRQNFIDFHDAEQFFEEKINFLLIEED